MSLRTTGLLTAALLSAAPLAAGALPASAATCTAPAVVSTQVSPRTLVLRAADSAALTVAVAVRANGCQLTGSGAVLTLPGGTTIAQPLALLSDTDGVSVFSASVPVSAAALGDTAAGRWKVRTATSWSAGDAPVLTEASVLADQKGGDDEGDEDEGDELESEAVESEGKVAVLHASSVSADAVSSALSKHNRITKGKALSVKGQLRQASWASGAEVGYAKQRVELQFRTSGGTYKKVKTLQTRAGGAFAESVKASKDGCYRVVFPGSSTAAAATSAGECIDVR
jgi:hypothetical protein